MSPTLHLKPVNLSSIPASQDCKSAEGLFDDTMKTGLPEEKIIEAWESLVTQFGPFKTQGSIKQTKIQGYDVIFVPCQFEKMSLDCQIAFDINGRIAGLYFKPSINK
jgi:uncharacterized protein